MPALPLASTSAMTDEEGKLAVDFGFAGAARGSGGRAADTPDDRLVRVALQRWFSRVCEDAVLQKDDELRSFIESDFGVSPFSSSTETVPNT